MTLWQHYYTPQTVTEAAALLADYNGEARIIAGGTDLILDLRHNGHAPVKALVDITKIDELIQIARTHHQAIIGAGITHNQIVRTGFLATRATCLVESCGLVGGPQVRNVGTLGGNVAHALPAGDGTTSLVALDAEAEILQEGERRRVPILEMYRGAGKSLLDPTRDILLNFRFRLSGNREGSAFKRIMRPQGVALPILGCAVWVRLADDGETIGESRICIGPIAPTPMRVLEIEALIQGSPLTPDLLDQAAATARVELVPRTSKYRATAGYRDEMIEVLLRQALPLAVQRARTGTAIPEGIGLQ